MAVVKRDGKGIIERYRPHRLSEVIGNEPIKKAMSSWMSLGENRSRTLMFIGTPSAGKTTMARIIALGLNCETGETAEPCLECDSCKSIMSGKAFHVVELNMSMKTGKDDADAIIEQMSNSCLTGRNQVYIFDEMQMMSTNSMNSVLKTFECPPPNTYVILCTTDPGKVIPALRSRCETYEFLPPSESSIKVLLRDVCDQEGLDLSIEDKRAILDNSIGLSYRQILTSLNQFVHGGQGAVAGEFKVVEGNYNLLIDNILAGNVSSFSKNLRKFWNQRSDIKFDAEGFRRTLRMRLGYLLMSESEKGLTSKGGRIYDVLKIFDSGVYGVNNENALPSIMKDGFAACVMMKG